MTSLGTRAAWLLCTILLTHFASKLAMAANPLTQLRGVIIDNLQKGENSYMGAPAPLGAGLGARMQNDELARMMESNLLKKFPSLQFAVFIQDAASGTAISPFYSRDPGFYGGRCATNPIPDDCYTNGGAYAVINSHNRNTFVFWWPIQERGFQDAVQKGMERRILDCLYTNRPHANALIPDYSKRVNLAAMAECLRESYESGGFRPRGVLVVSSRSPSGAAVEFSIPRHILFNKVITPFFFDEIASTQAPPLLIAILPLRRAIESTHRG